MLSLTLLLVMQLGCKPTNYMSSNLDTFQKVEHIPFEVTAANNIKFKSVLNGIDTLDLFFDTGGTELVLRHEAIKTQTSLLTKGRNQRSYKEENYVPLKGRHTLGLGSMTWDDLTVFPVELGPKETAGHFGWNLFKDRIVGLDYDKKRLTLYPSIDGITDGYVKLRIEYINTLFCVEGSVKVNEKSYPNRYLFDTGFQRAIILDKDLRAESNFPTDLPVLKESKLRNGAGQEFINQVVNVDQVCLGNSCAENVPTQLLSTPNPARFQTHILGNEFLKRFNTIFDFKNGYVYLKANSLMRLPYADAG